MDENAQDSQSQEQDVMQPVHAPEQNAAQGGAESPAASAQSAVPPASTVPPAVPAPAPLAASVPSEYADSAPAPAPSTPAAPPVPPAPRVPPMPPMPAIHTAPSDQSAQLHPTSGIASSQPAHDAASGRGDTVHTDTAEQSAEHSPSRSGASERLSGPTGPSQTAPQQSQQLQHPKSSMLFPQTDDAQGQTTPRTPTKPMFAPIPDDADAGDLADARMRNLWPSDPLEASPSSKRGRNAGALTGAGDNADSGLLAGISASSPAVSAKAAASADSDLTVEGMDSGLARLDPLAVHPRLSSRILCVVFGLLLLAAAAGMWWLGVRTANGQNFDDEVWLRLNTSLPSWLQSLVHLLAVSSTVIAISVVFALVGIVVAAVRKRWWLLGQLVVFAGLCYGSSLLKGVLPRPYLQNINSSASNTAPSGHTLLAAAAVVVLVCAVPRAWRAACAAVGSAYTLLVALSLVAGKWHRPTDVVMSLLIVGGWALLVLACTRTSGMDEIGTRSASASIQIVGSVMITGGIMISLYGAYLVWQIEPGLSLGASWTQSGACAATTMLVCGVSMLVFGLVLAMRQLTASPLTKLGLVGAPPAPPSK